MGTLFPANLLPYLDILRIFLRLLGLFVIVPGFSHQTIPMRVRLLFSIGISLGLYWMVRDKLPEIPSTISGLTWTALQETAIGLFMGFSAYVTYEGIALGAQFLGTQMGFGTAGLVDPQNHASASVIVPLQGWLVLLVFFLCDFHHQILQLFVLSFDVTLLKNFDVLSNAEVLREFVRISAKLFLLGVQIAAPFTLLFLACNIAVGILARTLPQMNMLLFSFPITILLGLCAIYLMAPELLNFMESTLGEMTADAAALLKTI